MSKRPSGKTQIKRLPSRLSASDVSALERIRENELVYQHCLRTLLRTLPGGSPVQTNPEVAVLGQTEIYPCVDGAVLYSTRDAAGTIAVRINPYTSKTMSEYQWLASESRLYTALGQPTDQRMTIELQPAPGLTMRSMIAYFAGPRAMIDGRSVPGLHWRVARGAIVGWDAPLVTPDQRALDDFQQELAIKNFRSGVAQSGHPQTWSENARKLADEFKNVLDTSTREEDVQLFLKQHPVLIYPEHIFVIPKLKLGSEHVTDFAYQVQSLDGRRHVFVEIESPTKRMFNADGTFSADYTKARRQILDWMSWITLNHAYLRNSLPDLLVPQFLLVMGRSQELDDSGAANRLEQEQRASGFSITTYDDLLVRFRRIVENAMGCTGQGSLVGRGAPR